MSRARTILLEQEEDLELDVQVEDDDDAHDDNSTRRLGANSDSRFRKTTKDWFRRNGGQDKTRTASSWFHYTQPGQDYSQKVAAFYIEVTPEDSADDTYFAAQGNHFGYFGMQHNRGWPWFQGKLVFSMWDTAVWNAGEAGKEAKVIECGENVLCTRFTGEGEGVKTWRNFDHWKTGNTYGFIVRAFMKPNDVVQQEGYYYGDDETWKLMSVMEVKKNLPTVSWGLTMLYSFVEQYTSRKFEASRLAHFGPAYVLFAGADRSTHTWTQVREAAFSVNGGSGAKAAHHEVDKTNHASLSSGKRRWTLALGANNSRTPDNTHLVAEPYGPNLPRSLMQFNDLDVRDKLPKGCPLDTCPKMKMKDWACFFFNLEHVPRTILFIIFILGVMGVCLGGCYHSCCAAPKRRAPYQRFP